MQTEPRQNLISRAATRIDATLWSRGLRRWRPPGLLTAERRDAKEGKPSRARDPFDYPTVRDAFQHPITIEDRLYNYVYYPGETDALAIHFSAFFGAWGERRLDKPQFSGYFHRLRMFWPLREYSFLFLCDTFGAEDNGCYYKGEWGDFFVERAMDEIIAKVVGETGADARRVVTLGSSMGGTAALRFALRHGFGGVVAVCPHIDLDLSAIHQNRLPHVAAILGTEDVTAPAHYPVTREVRRLAKEVRLPRLAVQSMLDDEGVHQEQVVPLVELWLARGGAVSADYHEAGGHTSDYATAGYFEHAMRWCLE
jgi:hypothetical protein